MLIKTKVIVLSTVKYQEKSVIVKCFTKTDGLKSYFVRDAFSSKKGNQKMAYFQPLTLLEIEANHKNKGTLEHFKEIKLATTFQTIPLNVVKSTIVMFLSEMLNNSIQEEERNEPLFIFIENALIWLDHHDQIANFHLVFLLEITKFLGFYPDTSNLNESPLFDMSSGVFSTLPHPGALTEHETNLFKKLLVLKFDTDQKSFNSIERQLLLKILIAYYGLHLDGFRKPKALEVLKEVFL
jgi:DNA repair protein RecO (recombination protein O)